MSPKETPKEIHNQTQNFQKFAAQLVSPSEVFEPRSARQRVNIPESLELLGSLASLTRSSLVQHSDQNSTSSFTPALTSATNVGSTLGSQAATSSVTTSVTTSGAASTAASKTPGIQYETSRKEYRQALEDQRIAEALLRLQAHRASAPSKGGQRAGSIIRRGTGSSATSTSAALQSDGKVQTSGEHDAEYRFQYPSFPQVSASVKPSPMKRSTDTYQPILRPSRPEQK